MRTLLILTAFLVGCPAGDDPELREEEFTITDEVTRLDLDNGNGNIFVNATAESIITVQAQHEGDDSEAVSQVAGGILSLSTRCSTSDGPCTIHYTLWVPEAVIVDAETTTGDIVLVGMGGDANLRTASGNVELDTFTADTLLVEVESGPTIGSRLSAEETIVTSASGSIDLTYEERPRVVEGITNSGDITLAVPTGTYNIETDSGSGDVQTEGLEHDADADARLTVEAAVGRIRMFGI